MRTGKVSFKVGGALLATLLVLAAEAAAQTAPAFGAIYAFTGPPSDGYLPQGGVVIGPGGVLYGTTAEGTSIGQTHGTVFSLTPPATPGGSWTQTVLYTFPGGKRGCTPYSGVAVSNGGVLYGTTSEGGATGNGTVFSLKPPATAGSPWGPRVLYSFQGGSDGGYPVAAPVIGKDGVLYGTTTYGGPANQGTVYSLSPPATPGGSWTKAVLYGFTGGADGGNPGPLVMGPDGVLYGNAASGGIAGCGPAASGCGTVYTLTPPAAPGGSWTESVLYSFLGGNDGIGPHGPVTIGPDGTLYGTTDEGGTLGGGTIYSITPPTAPEGPWTEAVLYSFGIALDSELVSPSGVAVGSGGVLYGTTVVGGSYDRGTVFSLTPPSASGGSWTIGALHDFYGPGDGREPLAGVVIATDGVLYGTAQYGGLEETSCGSSCGTVFTITP